MPKCPSIDEKTYSKGARMDYPPRNSSIPLKRGESKEHLSVSLWALFSFSNLLTRFIIIDASRFSLSVGWSSPSLFTTRASEDHSGGDTCDDVGHCWALSDLVGLVCGRGLRSLT